MKTLVKSLIAIVAILFATSLSAQKPIQKTYHTAIDPKEANTVFFDLKGKVEVETWNEDYILFYMTIHSNTLNEKVLDLLSDNGRYTLESEVNIFNHLFLSLPKIHQKITVNSMELKENFTYKVKVPKYLSVDFGCLNDVVILYEKPTLEETAGNLLAVEHIHDY